MLRLLASQHIFREVREDTFTNNRLSVGLDTGKPLWALIGIESFHSNTPGLQAVMCALTDEGMKSSAYLSEALLGSGNVNAPIATTTSDSVHSSASAPFNLAFGTKLTCWEFFNQPGQETRLARFGMAMKGVEAAIIPGKIDPHEVTPRFPLRSDSGARTHPHVCVIYRRLQLCTAAKGRQGRRRRGRDRDHLARAHDRLPPPTRRPAGPGARPRG